MDEFQLSLKPFVVRENLNGVYVATSSGELLLHLNGPQSAELGYIQNILFGGHEEIMASYQGLENMILPQMYAQGEEQAIYSKIGSLLYGIFYVGEMHVFKHWEKAKILSREFENIIKQSADMQQYING